MGFRISKPPAPPGLTSGGSVGPIWADALNSKGPTARAAGRHGTCAEHIVHATRWSLGKRVNLLIPRSNLTGDYCPCHSRVGKPRGVPSPGITTGQGAEAGLSLS